VRPTQHDHSVSASCDGQCPAYDSKEMCCDCGAPVLADTEDWPEPKCADCLTINELYLAERAHR
jgi:hypothetical protein